MKRPIFVRPVSDAERETLEGGLRSPDAFTLRRCQILLASADGQNAYQIARNLGCTPQTVRNAIHKFNEEGLEEALRRGSNRPHTVHRAFEEKGSEALREMLHRSPREFGKDSSLWTLAMAADRTPFSVPVTMRAWVRILIPQLFLSGRSSGPRAFPAPRTP